MTGSAKIHRLLEKIKIKDMVRQALSIQDVADHAHDHEMAKEIWL